MFGEDRIAEQLAQTREMLSQAVATPGAQAEPIVTEASEGRIQVTMGTDGRFERIKMTRSALRDGPEALIEQLTLALNDAIDQRSAQTAAPAPAVDMAELNERAARLQDASVRQFQEMSTAIGDLMGRLDARR
ncbi:YbaB/EbfC family nucleoid-associated protein [Glycomyces sp. A-F 0318]|uniref:YbaB/EbfC family nucleoid-associated protein n=1 Tax=Glycomyces amatae TaxID=2881355 RepID=UPI001E5E9463|nr:YbaB/EbfC family nucleoid-associated protein [Glycomyces amatae]MCD0447317.1 YbaB/EbfC family nucleoid-associated protein [Glycomyces amatae]